MQEKILILLTYLLGLVSCTYLGYPDKNTVQYEAQEYLDIHYPDIFLKVVAVQNMANSSSPLDGSHLRIMAVDPQGVKVVAYWNDNTKSSRADIRQQYHTALRNQALAALLSRQLPSGVKADVFITQRYDNEPEINIFCMNIPTATNKDYLAREIGKAIRQAKDISNKQYPAKAYFTWQGEPRGINNPWELNAQEKWYYNTWLYLVFDSIGTASPYRLDGRAADQIEKTIRARLPVDESFYSPEFYRIQQDDLSELFLLYEVGSSVQYISVIATLDGDIKQQETIDLPSTGERRKRSELEYLIPPSFRYPEEQTDILPL